MQIVALCNDSCIRSGTDSPRKFQFACLHDDDNGDIDDNDHALCHSDADVIDDDDDDDMHTQF